MSCTRRRCATLCSSNSGDGAATSRIRCRKVTPITDATFNSDRVSRLVEEIHSGDEQLLNRLRHDDLAGVVGDAHGAVDHSDRALGNERPDHLLRNNGLPPAFEDRPRQLQRKLGAAEQSEQVARLHSVKGLQLTSTWNRS